MCHFNADCLARRLGASSCLFDKKETSLNDLAHLNFKYLDMISVPSSHTLLFILASRFEAEGGGARISWPVRTGSEAQQLCKVFLFTSDQVKLTATCFPADMHFLPQIYHSHIAG